MAGPFNKTNYKYEIIFDDKTVIERLPDNKEFDTFFFNFLRLKDVESKTSNGIFDFVVYIDEI